VVAAHGARCLAAARGSIRAADFGHLDARGLQDPGQAGTVAGGPFHRSDRDDAKALGPSERVVGNSASAKGFPASVMTARWLVSRWVSAPMTTRADAATMVMSPSGGDC
jgi:hypothetical protein